MVSNQIKQCNSHFLNVQSLIFHVFFCWLSDVDLLGRGSAKGQRTCLEQNALTLGKDKLGLLKKQAGRLFA
jgi:hypothetical protein